MFGVVIHVAICNTSGSLPLYSPLVIAKFGRQFSSQEPLLFRGTIRENLDPSEKFTDAALWQALRSCRLAGAGDRESEDWTRPASRGSTTVRPSQPFGPIDGGVNEGELGDRAKFGLETDLQGYGSNLSAGGNLTVFANGHLCLFICAMFLVIFFTLQRFSSERSDRGLSSLPRKSVYAHEAIRRRGRATRGGEVELHSW